MKRVKNGLSVVAILMVASRACGASSPDGEPIVGRQSFVINGPAGGASGAMAGGPIMGNGDVGVMLSGPAEELIFYIGKNDSWGSLSQSVMAVGQMRIMTPALQGATLRTTVDMQHAELRGEYAKATAALASRSWVDANRNLLCVELSNTGTVQLAMTLQHVSGTSFLFEPDAANPSPDSRKIAVATRILGNADASGFTLEPGKTTVVAAVILSDLDCKGKDPLAEAKSLAAALTPGKIAEYGAMHRQWWQAFWSKSFIEIPDKILEQHWYAALYIMASCSRAGKVAPGLWGNWVTTDKPGWHGDFHLNYNFQAPYFGVYAANHADVSLPFYQAINEFVPRGRKIAAKKGWKGVHFPVSIGPWGMCPEGDDSDWGQRSNAAYAALNFIWYYQYTQDQEWLRNSGYNFLREVVDFWEDYLKLENGRYIIYNDSIHEGSGADMNGVLSLGLVRTLFKNMLMMSADLGVDENRRAKWQDICGKLSAYPTQERNGRTVFRYTEKGMDWCNDNTLGIQHIFPAGAIGLDSEPQLLEISRNMIHAMGRWSDGNGFATWYSACARVGHDPKAILAGLRTESDKHSMPNRLLSYGGGGIENCAGFNAINEMLLQSHDGVLRFFPCWPKDQDARFGSLRTVGAFLVSAEMQNGVVSGVRIVSEKGRDCVVVNPWPGKKATLVRKGGRPGSSAETKQGERFTLETAVNETIELSPEK
ncbi:MAG: hypothetical protein NTW21_29330 [Verrucomicrobia bacterium]|nr:hypothetical protein [Verrucomicrobiota bacterium]